MSKREKMGRAIGRRRILSAMLLGGGGLALRSIATGLSTAFLSEGVAHAEPPSTPTFLILNTCAEGDPLNVSAPGSMAGALAARWNEVHADPAMKAVDVGLGSKTYQAAGPWAKLPADLRARLAFIHHATGAETHTEYTRVLRVFDALKGAAGNGSEMLPSAIASELAAALGTIQREPMTLGAERLTYESRYVEQLAPIELKSLFAGGAGNLESFAKLRDSTLDKIYADLKSNGTKAQRAYLDRVAISRSQAAQLGVQLAADLAPVPVVDEAQVKALLGEVFEDYPFDPIDHVITAVALLKYKVTPVVTVHIPFGSDNHNDSDFARETLEVKGGVQMIGFLWSKLVEAGLSDKTTFASLNTFGRTFMGGSGRAHNSRHHVMTLFGPHVKPGVAGAPVLTDRDYGAAPMSSVTGAVTGSTDIDRESSFAAAARTLMKATGVSDARIDVRLPGAKTITAVVS